MKICPHCNLYIIEKEVNSISDKFLEYQHIKFDNDLIYPKCMESNNERYKLEYTTHIPNNSYKFNPLNSIENTIQIMSGTHTRTI